MSKTYLLIGDAQKGPYSPDEIRAMLSSGKATSQTLYWEEGMTDWKSLGERTGQRAAPTTIAPPRRPKNSSAPVDFKEALRDRKDLSARRKAITPGKALAFIILFFLLLTAMIELFGRWLVDPAQQFAEKTGEISSHK